MITNDAELEVVRTQLNRAEAALDALRQEVQSKNERTFDAMAESYIDMVQSLRAEIDTYQGRVAPNAPGHPIASSIAVQQSQPRPAE